MKIQGENRLHPCQSLSHLFSLKRLYSSVQPQLLQICDLLISPHWYAEVWHIFTPWNNQDAFYFSESFLNVLTHPFLDLLSECLEEHSVAEQSLFSYWKLINLPRINFMINSEIFSKFNKVASNTYSAHVVILVLYSYLSDGIITVM